MTQGSPFPGLQVALLLGNLRLSRRGPTEVAPQLCRVREYYPSFTGTRSHCSNAAEVEGLC